MLSQKYKTVRVIEVVHVLFVTAYNNLKDIRQGGSPFLGIGVLVYKPDVPVMLELLKYHLKDIGVFSKVLEIRQEDDYYDASKEIIIGLEAFQRYKKTLEKYDWNQYKGKVDRRNTILETKI